MAYIYRPMSTEHKPYLSDQNLMDIMRMVREEGLSTMVEIYVGAMVRNVRDRYEKERAKDREGIVRLKEALMEAGQRAGKDAELTQELYDALAMVEHQRQMKHRNRTIHDPRMVISVDHKKVWKAVKLALQSFKERGITPTYQ